MADAEQDYEDEQATFLTDMTTLRSSRASYSFLDKIRNVTPEQYNQFKAILPDYISYMSETAQSQIPYLVNFSGASRIELKIPLQKRVSKLTVTGLEMPNMLNGISISENVIQWSDIDDLTSDGSSFYIYEASIEPANYTVATLVSALLTSMNAVLRRSTGQAHNFICEQNVNGLNNGVRFISLQETTSNPLNNPISIQNNSKLATFTLANHGLVNGQTVYLTNVNTDIGGIPQDVYNTSFIIQVVDVNHFTFSLPISAYYDDQGGGSTINVLFESVFAFRSSAILTLLGFPNGDSSVAVPIRSAKLLRARAPYVVGGPLTTVVLHWMNIKLPSHGLAEGSSFTLAGTQREYGLEDGAPYIVQKVIDTNTIAINVPVDYALSNLNTSVDDSVDDINRVRLSSIETNRIGFSTSQSNVINGVIYNAINLSGDTSCYLTCREIDKLAYWSGVPDNSLCKVQMTDIPGYTIFNSQSTDPVVFPPHRRPEISTLTLELKDIKGQTIDLKNLTMSGCIQIHKDPPPVPDKLKQFIQ